METKDIIKDLCGKNGISVTALEASLGFSNGSLQKSGFLRSDRLLAVAKYFKVSMEYLMGEEKIENNQSVDKDFYDLYYKFQRLDSIDKESVMNLLESGYRRYLQKGELETNSTPSEAV